MGTGGGGGGGGSKAPSDLKPSSGPVEGAPEVIDHPHTRPRGMVLEEEGYQGLANPVKYSRTPTAMQKTPPAFGEDTRAILGEAGYSAAEIDALIENGAALERKG